MANHMKEVSNMLGVELGERFQVFDSVGREYPCKFYFTEKDIMIDGTDNCADTNMLKLLVCGIYTIKHQPWMPNCTDTYYSVGADGYVEFNYWECDTIDLNYYKLGNCYPSPQKAEANKDKWIAFYSSNDVLEV